MYLSYFPRNLPADTTGVKAWSGGILLREEVYDAVEAIYLEYSLKQLTDGKIRLEVYDETAGEVTLFVNVQTEVPRVRGVANIKPRLTKGNTYSGRLNVFQAGASGSLVGDGWIRFVMIPYR